MLRRNQIFTKTALILTSASLLMPPAAIAQAATPPSTNLVEDTTEFTSVVETSQNISVSAPAAGDDDLGLVREELAATTPAELDAIHAAEAEQARLAEEAAQQAAAEEAARQQQQAAAQAPAAPQQGTGSYAPAQSAPASTTALPNGSFLSAAYAQLGSTQDCTVLVERALRAIGYNVGDIGPMGFGPYGVQVPVSQIQAGDIMMRPGHVAIYTGDGVNHRALHSGWGGVNATVESPYEANPNAYAVIIRVP